MPETGNKKNRESFIRTQNMALFQFLKKGKNIARLDAIDQVAIINLPGRIYDLKERGHLILSKWVTLISGKRVKCYWLNKS